MGIRGLLMMIVSQSAGGTEWYIALPCSHHFASGNLCVCVFECRCVVRACVPVRARFKNVSVSMCVFA